MPSPAATCRHLHKLWLLNACRVRACWSAASIRDCGCVGRTHPECGLRGSRRPGCWAHSHILDFGACPAWHHCVHGMQLSWRLQQQRFCCCTLCRRRALYAETCSQQHCLLASCCVCVCVSVGDAGRRVRAFRELPMSAGFVLLLLLHCHRAAL